MAKKYKLSELATILAAKLDGDGECIITKIAPLDQAAAGAISFLENPSYKKHLPATHASAVILTAECAASAPCSTLTVSNPYLAYAKISALFDPAPSIPTGIHPTVIMGKECEIAASAKIAPYCVIGNHVKIGERVEINPHCAIGDDVVIGDDSKLYPNVTVYYGVHIGQRAIFHSGVVIGSDGFGMANDKGVWTKIHQLASVIIGDDVELGANTTVDRGALENTVIEDGVKIDNQVQVAHNVKIGAHTAIAGCTGIAGSVTIGKYCMIGGCVGINGHIKIADRTIVTGMSAIGKTIDTPGGIYASGIPAMPHRTWWRVLSRLTQLEDLIQRVNKLEKQDE